MQPHKLNRPPGSRVQPGGTVLVRPRRWPWGSMLFVFWVVVFVWVGLEIGGAGLDVFGVLAVLSLGLAVRYLFGRVTVGAEGLEVVNLFGAWRGPWSEIAAFTTKYVPDRGGGWTYPVMLPRSGRRRELTAMGDLDISTVETAIEWLQSMAPAGARPEYVARHRLAEFLAERSGSGPDAGPPAPLP
ncbi:MAG: PH domain-containing protein [Candidatus Dormibacteria bacterium]|jgi:hypothetical protein